MDVFTTIQFLLGRCSAFKEYVCTKHSQGDFEIMFSGCNVKLSPGGVVFYIDAKGSELIWIPKAVRHGVSHPESFMDGDDPCFCCVWVGPGGCTGNDRNSSDRGILVVVWDNVALSTGVLGNNEVGTQDAGVRVTVKLVVAESGALWAEVL